MVLMSSSIWSIPHQKFHFLFRESELRKQMKPNIPAIVKPQTNWSMVKACSLYL